MSLRNLLPNGKPSTPNGEAPKKKESMNFIDNLDTYGTYKFKGKVAAPYLKAQGLPVDTLENPTWTHTLADKVAKAVVEWCKDKGATMATHWFQPLGSAGVRRGRMSNRGFGRSACSTPLVGPGPGPVHACLQTPTAPGSRQACSGGQANSL